MTDDSSKDQVFGESALLPSESSSSAATVTGTPAGALSAGTRGVDAQTVAAAQLDIVETLFRDRVALAEDIVEMLRADIVDYKGLPALALTDDVQATAVATITDLLECLRDTPTPDRDLEAIRRSAARRVHQEVSLPSLLHSYRIWGAKVWQEVLKLAGSDPVRREAAIGLVSRIFDYIDRVSVTLAQVYLEEAAGAYRARDVVRGDILESLLLGRALSDRARVDISRLSLTSGNRIAVLIVRLSEVSPERLRAESLKVLQSCRETVSARSKTLLGVRESDVICIVRVSTDKELSTLVAGAHELASRSPLWRVCMGRPHDGIEGIPRSFHEAQEAAIVSTSLRRHRRAVLFSEVMLDRILVHSAYGNDLLEEFMRPLLAYDEKNSTSLVATLRAYVSNNMSLTKTAQELILSPNTVSYRVKRIGQLTGQDLTTNAGVVTLSMALRLLDG